jgi:hypothetical protein
MVQYPDRIDRPGKELYAIEAVEVPDLLDEGTVTIEEHGWLHVTKRTN